MSFEVNAPPMAASMGHLLKLGEGEKGFGEQILRQGEERFGNPRIPFLIQLNNEKEA
jgi:hypothetical protein